LFQKIIDTEERSREQERVYKKSLEEHTFISYIYFRYNIDTIMKTEPAIFNTNTNVSSLKHPPMQFLIMPAPRPENLHQYIKECKKHNVTDIVRVCEPTYSKQELDKAGIKLHEMPYPDGHSPPEEVLDRWIQLVDERFFHPTTTATSHNASATSPAINGTAHSVTSTSTNTSTGPTIAVHCVAGLGRAPVLVAIALIEFAKMDPVTAADFIRKHRRGAINNTQLDWLERYKRRYKGGNAGGGCCVVM